MDAVNENGDANSLQQAIVEHGGLFGLEAVTFLEETDHRSRGSSHSSAVVLASHNEVSQSTHHHDRPKKSYSGILLDRHIARVDG